ncbi:MAG TPA: tetratricopeptide repeat protein [bacterium]|nr:tetratricopeptide repeat protein [bacterium]
MGDPAIKVLFTLLVLVAPAVGDSALELVGDGNVALREGNYEDAVVSFNRALELEPGYPAAINGLGQVALARGRYEEALRLLQPLIGEYQGDPIFLQNLGIIFKYVRDYGNAVEMFRMSDKLLPDNPPVLAGLAESLLQQGDTLEALPLTRRLVDLDPARPDYHYLHGMAALFNDIKDEAQSAFERTLELNPSFAYAFEPLFEIYYEKDELIPAQELAGRWCADQTGSGSAWRAVGIVSVRQGDFPAALEATRAMLERGRLDNNLVQIVTKWLRATDRDAEARELWERVLVLDPHNVAAVAELER